MRSWIWTFHLLPALADVLCDVRMSERSVMMVNPTTGDEKYTASTLEIECNDVYQVNGATVSDPWPLYSRVCGSGKFYDPVADGCGYCPDNGGQEPKDVFPDNDIPDGASTWWERCMPMESQGSFKCLCSYRFDHYDEVTGVHQSGQRAGYADLVSRCSAEDEGCMSYVPTSASWSAGISVKMPTYTCTGLDPFAPAGDTGSFITLPPLEKDPLFEFLKMTFADGVTKRSTVMEGWNFKSNVFKILFMSRIAKGGQDVRVGPSLEEITTSCTISLNIYFDQEGTAVNNGQPVNGGLVPIYSPLCVEEEVLETKDYLKNITKLIVEIAYSNVTCNSSNQKSGGRRLHESEVDKVMNSWAAMEKAQGLPPPSVFQLIKRRQHAEHSVKHKAKEPKRRLQEEHYVVKSQVTVFYAEDCAALQTPLAPFIQSGEWQGLFAPLITIPLGDDQDLLSSFRIEPAECAASPSGGSQLVVSLTGKAGPTTGSDDLQTEWFTGLQVVATDNAQVAAVAAAMKTAYETLTGATIGEVTLSDWSVEVGTEMMEGTDGGSNGDQGDQEGDNGREWWEFYEGMPCDEKRHLTQERERLLLQHAFIITGKDTWAGCKGLLDSWVVYGEQKQTKTTNKCAVPYEDMSGAVNPAWANDPCCNWVKRQHMCCAPRIVEENITVVASLDEPNIALYSAATDSGTLALDLAMMYMEAETEAAKACFAPFKAFMDATSDVWKVVDECQNAVAGSWSETYQVQLGSKCNSDIDCYTGECYAPVSSRSGSSTGVKQKYCKTPDEMENPNWGLATLTCLIDKSIGELKGRLSVRLKMPGTATASQLADAFLNQPDMTRPECHGHDAWNIRTEEECMASKECNYDRAITNETECLNPCEEGDLSCSSFCAAGDWEVSELPTCQPKVADGTDPWSACWQYVDQMRSTWNDECNQCNQDCEDLYQQTGEWQDCGCHEPDGKCDFWRREEAARKECMDDYCSRYSTGTEEASLYRWNCIFPGMSFDSDRKAQCLSECQATGGPNPVAPQSCRAILNPATATEDVCWKLGQGWIDVHYKEIPNWDWSYGPPPPESCIIKSYEVLNGKPYVPPPPYGPTCLPECEDELESCIHNPTCWSWLEDEGKSVYDVCQERYTAFEGAFQDCMNQQWASCSGIGCLRIHRACRRSSGLEDDETFKALGCGACEGPYSSHVSRQLHCAEELSVEQCRWNVSTMNTASQPCAPDCMWELCDQAFKECQIDGGSLQECNNQTISMNQCRSCYFISCEEKCSQGACDVAFESRDQAYRECAGCASDVTCNPSSPCYGDNSDSSCNWRWQPEFGHTCPILCEESLRVCQEKSVGFCWEWFDDLGKSQQDICNEEFDAYRGAFEGCLSTSRDTIAAANPDNVWREVEIKAAVECAATTIPQDWKCLTCDGEWNSYVSWSNNIGPKCIDGSISFDGGKTVPSTCASSCRPRTCPEYPVNCEGRFYDTRKCQWNEYSFRMCNKSTAEAGDEVVASSPECAACSLPCSHQCQHSSCADIMIRETWSRTSPLDLCMGCPDTYMCHPGDSCFINDKVLHSDTTSWEELQTLFEPMMQLYQTCTGFTLNRRLQVKTAPAPAEQKMTPKMSRRPQPENRASLEEEVLRLWQQGNRLRNMGRNKRMQMTRLTNTGARADAARARRTLLERQHQSLRKRYQSVWTAHEETLRRWQARGGVPEAPPHYAMPSFEEKQAPKATATRRLQSEPTMVELQCSSGDCSAKSALCDAFFNRGGVQQELVDSLVQSFSYDVLPWENQDRICQDLGEICFMSVEDTKTAILNYPYTDTPIWAKEHHFCNDLAFDEKDNCVCTSCSDAGPLDEATCDYCCRCKEDSTGFDAGLKYEHNPNYRLCDLLGKIITQENADSGIYYHMDYDEKLLGGAGACRHWIDIWQVAKIPDECHEPSCYSDPDCASQCNRPEATQEMCPGNFAWSFFKSTREWREGILSTRSDCEAESCYPQPWIPTKEQCDQVSHCEADCPYCETDQYWDWENKKTKVKCSFVATTNLQPLSEADCRVACGGSFTDSCKYMADTQGTSRVCLTPPPSDGPGTTVYEQCVGQKTLTGATVTSATYELLQCGSFTTEQCGWAEKTFGGEMDCRIKRLQCKNKADCSSAGRCDYEADDWQIQEQKGLCVKPMDFSSSDAFRPDRDMWNDCNQLGGEHRSYGCLMNQITTADGCAQAMGKWFNWAPSKAKCEVPGYAWKTGSAGNYTSSGTFACCMQLRGSVQEGRCEMFTQDDTLASCEKCGGHWMSIFKFRPHGAWVEGNWQKAYSWMSRAFESSNKWVSRINFEKITEIWQSLISETRAVPATNFISCRLNPTLDTLGSIAAQTAAQTVLGSAPLLPGTDAATQLGDVVIAPFANTVEGASEIDVNVDLVVTAAVVAEYASTNASTADNSTAGARRLQTLSESLTASCYTVVQYNNLYIGQLKGDCLVFKPQQTINPVQVCFPLSDSIPVYPAFTVDAIVEKKDGQYQVKPVTVARSSDGLSLCASLSEQGTYCPAATYASVTPETQSAPSGCGKVTAISQNVVQEAEVLKATGKVALPGLVKLGQAPAEFRPKAVYISATGTTESKDDFAQNAQQGNTGGGRSSTTTPPGTTGAGASNTTTGAFTDPNTDGSGGKTSKALMTGVSGLVLAAAVLL